MRLGARARAAPLGASAPGPPGSRRLALKRLRPSATVNGQFPPAAFARRGR